MSQSIPDLRMVPTANVSPDPNQPRQHFSEESLKDLIASVSDSGVIQPLVVRTLDDGFKIISGERRWRAATKAEKPTVPVLVRDDLTEAQILAWQITENLQRQDLTLHELVESVSRLVQMTDLTAASKTLGKDKGWISRISNAKKLWQPVRDLIKSGHLVSIDGAHDLSTLHEIDPARAKQLADEFTTPPEWRATPPTRELLRAELERARTAANTKESAAREKQEAAQDRKEASAGEIKALTTKLSSGSKTPFQKGRDELGEAKDAERKRAGLAVMPLARRFLAAMKLQLPKETDGWGTVVDADGEERVFNLLPPSPENGLSAPELMDFDHTRGLWQLEVEVRHEELLHLLSLLENKSSGSSLPPRFESVRVFIAEFTQPCSGECIKSEWLFEHYTKWCKKKKREVIEAPNDFAVAMEICGIKKTRKNSGRYWVDIKPTGGKA